MKKLFSTLILSGCFSVLSAQLFDTSMWVPNGPVHSMVKYGNQMIIGGDFSYVGKAIGYGIPIDTINLQLLSPDFPRVDGEVYCVAPDKWGGWYIGGKFSMVGGRPRMNLAHIGRNGQLYDGFRPDPDGPVYALWVATSPMPNVYVGGDFTFIGNEPRNNIAVINPYSGSAFVNWKPNVNGPVYAITPRKKLTITAGELPDYSVYIGGDFTSIDNQGRNYVAELSLLWGNVSQSHVLRNFSLALNGPVYCLEFTRKNLYIGGTFTTIGTMQQKFIAKYSTITNSVSTSFVPNVSGPVFCFGRYGAKMPSGSSGPPPPGRITSAPAFLTSSIFIGGGFLNVNGQPRSNFAEIDTVTGTLQSTTINTNGPVYAIEISKRDYDIYIGGTFTTVNSQPRRNFAATDSTGTLRPQVFDLSNAVKGLCLNDTLLYVAGEFVCYNGVERNNVAIIDLSTKIATAFNIGADNYVTSLVLSPDNKLYVGGNFVALGGQPRWHVGGIDLTSNTVLPVIANTNGLVRTMCLLNNKLYFGGLFSLVNNVSRSNLGAVDLTSYQLLNWHPDANGTINSMQAGIDRIWIGGFYSSIGGYQRNNLAAVDTLGGYCITAFNPNVNNGVYSISMDGGMLYAGGWFTQTGGQPRNFASLMHGYNSNTTGFNPSPDDYVRSVYFDGAGSLVLGGEFDEVSGQTRNHIAFVDPSSGVLQPFDPDANHAPLAYYRDGNILYTGGEFTAMSGLVHPFFMALNTQYVPGTPELNQTAGFLLYPNPAVDELTIALQTTSQDLSAFILDMQGRKVIDLTRSQILHGEKIDIRDLTSGVYSLVLTAPERVLSERFVVVR